MIEIKEQAPLWPHSIPEGWTVSYAFSTGGKDYFKVTDTFNTSSHRGLSAAEVYEEWQSRLTHDTLRIFIQAMKEELRPADGIVKVDKIAQFINFMDERLNWPVPTSELYWKMASVLLFDASESPYYYDKVYADKHKIPHWKKHGVDDFFLFNHLKTLLPLPTIPANALATLQEIVNQAVEMQGASLPNHLQRAYKETLNPQPSLAFD